VIIEDINVQMLAPQRMNSIFKSGSERIISINNMDVPGPGSYELRSKYKKFKNNLGETSQSSMHSIIHHKTTNPSIPADSLGYKFTKQQTY